MNFDKPNTNVYGVRMGKKQLTDEQNERLRTVLVQLVEQSPSQEDLGDKLDTAQGHISAIIRGQPGVGGSYDLIRKVAALSKVPESFFLYGEIPGMKGIAKAEKYPNRALGLRFARENRYDEEAMRVIDRMDPGRDLTPLEWFELARLEHQRLKVMSKTPETKARAARKAG